VFEFKCSHAGCYLPWAHIYNGVMTVQSRHSGHIHNNAIGLGELYRIMRQSQGIDAMSGADFAMTTARRAMVTTPDAIDPVDGFELICIDKRCTMPWGIVAKGRLFVVSWHQAKHANSVSIDVLRLIFGAKYHLNGG